MSNSPRPGLLWIGVIIAVIGIIAMVVPAFTTQQTTDLAKIGDVKLTAKEQTTHVVPPLAGPLALGLGVILIGAAFVSRRG